MVTSVGAGNGQPLDRSCSFVDITPGEHVGVNRMNDAGALPDDSFSGDGTVFEAGSNTRWSHEMLCQPVAAGRPGRTGQAPALSQEGGHSAAGPTE
jgi:hypothetical protein